MKDIFDIIVNLQKTSPFNKLTLLDEKEIYDEPLVGVADGYDPLFRQYKQVIGDFYLTPEEIMVNEAVLRNMKFEKGKLSIVCWALPFKDHIKKANAARETIPSIKWSHSYERGEKFNNLVRQTVADYYINQNILSCAPAMSNLWQRIEHLPGGHTSNWSERHALYAAGLGTFSINDGFITDKGMAMRCGSVIVNTILPISKRKYTDYRQNCLFVTKGLCGKCMERCPANAITVNGHNKVQCRAYRDKFLGEYLHDKVGLDIDPNNCGFCQTGTPCESINPMKDKLK